MSSPGITGGVNPDEKKEKTLHLRAWAPFFIIILAVPTGLAIGLTTSSLIQVIMLAGALTALILAPSGARSAGLHRGAKHAGVIIFDICGAGALAAVILESGFAEAALGGITGTIPVLLAPFVFAALIQTAQGSRVVTAVVTSGILAGSLVAEGFHPVALILMIIAGSFVVSYVTDPFFWIVHHATGDDLRTVVRHYTLPLAVSGPSSSAQPSCSRCWPEMDEWLSDDTFKRSSGSEGGRAGIPHPEEHLKRACFGNTQDCLEITSGVLHVGIGMEDMIHRL
jgi:hypothetical protein